MSCYVQNVISYMLHACARSELHSGCGLPTTENKMLSIP